MLNSLNFKTVTFKTSLLSQSSLMIGGLVLGGLACAAAVLYVMFPYRIGIGYVSCYYL
jgi:hypothetical protein